MNDQEKAAFYKEHKDDPDVWEDAESGSTRRNLEALITVRFSAEDAELIRSFAKDLNLSYSEVVRQAVRNYLQPRLTFHVGKQGAFDAALGPVKPIRDVIVQTYWAPTGTVTASATRSRPKGRKPVA